ncbi:MAG: hypothetical protein ACYCTI_06820 [Acidimicrobiales bacterium]
MQNLGEVGDEKWSDELGFIAQDLGQNGMLVRVCNDGGYEVHQSLWTVAARELDKGIGQHAVKVTGEEQTNLAIHASDLAVHGRTVDPKLAGDVLDRGAADAVSSEAPRRRVEEMI